MHWFIWKNIDCEFLPPDRGVSSQGDIERGGTGEDARSLNTLSAFQANKNYTITESTRESMYLKMGAMGKNYTITESVHLK